MRFKSVATDTVVKGSRVMFVRADGVVVRLCNTCGEKKTLDNFYVYTRADHTGPRYTVCKPCGLENVAEAQKAKKAWVQEYKLTRGCADCGYAEHPAALDFDHLPGTEKFCDIKNGQHMGWKTLFAEVELCEVVCANCHRIRTVERNAEARVD